jgi:hypothetical protein
VDYFVRSRSVLCKDRVFETFRSLCTQRPTQSSILRRILNFNAEVAEYAQISRTASHELNMLAQEGIVERIPGFSAQFVIKSPSTHPGCLHYNNRERSSYSFSISPFTLFSTLFSRQLGAYSRSAEKCCCLDSGRSICAYRTVCAYAHH